MLQLLLFIFILVIVIQLFFYLIIFSKFGLSKQRKALVNDQSISIIIAAHNEAENLKQFLPKILDQNYPSFEVIIVNDASTDTTLQVIESFDQEKLNIITIPKTKNYLGNKKNAISKGIQASKYESLLFIDADCYPSSKNWINEMTSLLAKKKEIILGYGAYKKTPSFLNKLIRYETLMTAIQYFSYAKLGIPYMGVGRNLAYKKGLFKKNSGFDSHNQLKSGDDDLFINEVASLDNVEICFSKNSITISEPKTNFKSWFKQKRRHISTATYYKPIHQFLLGSFYISQLLFWALAIILLAFSFNWQLVTTLVGIRLISQYIVLYISGLKLNEQDLIIFTPVLDIFLVFTQLGLFLSNQFYKPKHW